MQRAWSAKIFQASRIDGLEVTLFPARKFRNNLIPSISFLF
jgi:hypothetical protein